MMTSDGGGGDQSACARARSGGRTRAGNIELWKRGSSERERVRKSENERASIETEKERRRDAHVY